MNKTGKCHCGAVEFQIKLGGPLGRASRCDCSFCSRRAAANISVPLANFKILKGADNLTLYTWGTNTAQHHFCKTCGIYTHHQRRSDPSVYGVNIACLEGINIRDYADAIITDGINHPSDI